MVCLLPLLERSVLVLMAAMPALCGACLPSLAELADAHVPSVPAVLPSHLRFVDDTNVYRVTIHKTFEGNL